ncbi:OmpA family protein [Persicitalea jodogahamensis]|uniref:OmpA-like domain-containing protein n=1 Tax=Persicitalea jodogahamensis TaxID=402147 RepID=A0A8J3D5J3_9BACT|nr:OmpA family protein [Persicitalea jodogahamensis]GHB52075.1 hypothetical protein GCM10007390_00860 [Persicitalea jodogahamensis]
MNNGQFIICTLLLNLGWVLFWDKHGAESAVSQPATECARLVGTVRDAETQEPLAARLFGKVGNRKIQIGETDAAGNYRVELDCESKMLIVEASHYQALKLPLSLDGKGTLDFFVPLTLRALEKQISDQPYEQSEQAHFVLNTAESGGKATATRIVRVSDVTNNKALAAEVCLFFTKTQKKVCQKLDITHPTWEVVFAEKDIIALEVRATGYQPYNGNLIMDQLNATKRLYEIRLQPQISILSLTLGKTRETVQIRLVDAVNKTFTMEKNGTKYFSANITLPQRYRVVLRNEAGQLLHEEYPATLTAGLNLRYVEISEGKKQEVAAKEMVASEAAASMKKETIPEASLVDTSSMEGIKLIHFAQSDYKLQPVEQWKLERLAEWLRDNPGPTVRIVGHTDNVGDSRLNQTLSEFRAKVTANFLHRAGIPPERIYWTGVGSKYPIAPNDTEENKQANRRASIQVIF